MKRIMITGTSSGIGKGIAIRFARGGYEIINLGLDYEETFPTLKEIEKLGGRCKFFKVDVSKVEDIYSFGFNEKLDVLVNNAGIAHYELLNRTSDEKFDDVIRAVLLSRRMKYQRLLINCSRAVASILEINQLL